MCRRGHYHKGEYPGKRDALNKAARAALLGLGDVKAPSPIRAAVYAAATATGEAGAISRASIVVGYALDAAGSKGLEAFETFLHALATDANLLDQKFSTVTLANSQLWPSNIPDWIRNSWDEMRSALLDADEEWDVWTDWYEKRLAGEATNQDGEIARLLIDDDIWAQGPEVANAHLKELAQERAIFEQATADEPDELPDANAIPQQTTAASRFALDAEGRIDLLPDAALSNALQREIYQEVRYKALALSGLGHNQLAEMSEPVARFLAAAPECIDDVSIIRLWSRGNTLRRMLNAHDMAAASVDHTDPAILSTAVAEMLRDLVESYNVFIIGDTTGRELDEVRLGPREREEARTVVDVSLTIVEAVAGSEALATAAAIEALTEQIEAARFAPASVDGDQAVDLSRKTTGNFVVELVRAAYIHVRGEPGFAWKEYRAGIYRGFGALTAAGVVGWPIISFIVNNAEILKVFVERAFHNPTLIQIIEVISKGAGGQ